MEKGQIVVLVKEGKKVVDTKEEEVPRTSI